MDIHICGGCLSKFTDIYKFINHKLSCNLSSASSLKQTETLIKEAKVISQHIQSNKTAPQTSNTETFLVDTIICAKPSSQPLAGEPKQSSSKEDGHSTVFMPQCPARNALEVTASNFSQSIKQDIKASCRSTRKFFTVADTKLKESNPSMDIEKSQQNVFSHISPRRNVDLSTDDISVYVVSPKSFASSVKGQCDFSPQMKFQDNTTGRISWADSCSMSHLGGEISNGYTAESTMAASVHQKLENSMKLNYTNIDAVIQGQHCNANGSKNGQPPITSLKSKFSLDTDSTPSSDSSTPCPEDLEVGQISAAMLGQDRNQGEVHRTIIDASLNGNNISAAEESAVNVVQNSVKAENQSYDYIRDKAASAPIIKNEVKNRRRVSIEKRERLQGVSDDLLACSPYLDAFPNANGASNKKALKKPISATLPPQMCYKAIFTSPSSAGHRLAPTQTEQSTYSGNPSSRENPNTVPLQSLSRTQKSSKAILYKNISASARRMSKLADSTKPQHGAAAPKKKTERKIAFDKLHESALPVEAPDVNSNSQVDNKICQEHFETLTVHKQEAPELSSLTSENGSGKAVIEDRTYKSLPHFELTDLNSLSSAVQKQEEAQLQNAKTKSYELKSTEEPQVFHILGLNTANSKSEFSIMTQGSNTIELFSPMSAALDENAVIMVYKTMDSNIHQMVAKNVQTSQAEMQSLQSAGMYQTCSFSDSSHGQNLMASQPILNQQGTDSDLYINIVPSDNTDCGMPQLLFQNFVCSGPNLSQLIAISAGSSASGSSPGVFTVSQGGHGAVDGSSEVVVQRLLDVKQKQEVHVEKEKCIMRPRKAATSASAVHAVEKSVSEARGTNSGQKGKISTLPASAATGDLTPEAYKDDGPDGKKSKYFTCKFDKCRYTTIFYKDFQRHYRTHTGERPFQCKDCGKTFNRSDKLKIHSRWHAGSKPFKCHQCDYAAVEGGSLKKHMRTHTDERPFKCQICSYASRNSSQLIVHLRTHTGDAPFHCTTCTAKFKINSDLKRHLRVHTGEKPFKCERCDYKSSNKGNLKTHVKINHSEENEIRCPKCDFVTSSKKRLREHAKLHDTKPLERCSQCEYTCTSRNALRTHTSIHNKDKPYHCSYCSYSTKQGGNLKKHVENLHLERPRPSRHSSNTRSATSNNASGGRVKASTDRCEERKHRGKSFSCRKLFECSDCGSSFVRADSLRCHMKQHSPDAGESTCKETATLEAQRCQAAKEFTTCYPATDASSSSGYGCQGIQQIVAAASRIYEDNLFSVNITGDVADETQHLCDSASLPNHPSLSTPYDISRSCVNVVEPKIKTSLVHQEPGVGVNSSPAQLQGLSEGIKRTHLPWEHQSYTMSVRGDESSNAASLVSSRRSGKAPGSKAVDLKSTGSHSNQAKPKQPPSVSHNSKNGGSQSNGPKCQKRKKCDTVTGPPASSASLVVSPIPAPSLHSKQSYYPDVLLQQIMPGVHQAMDQLETAMVVTQQVGDGPGTYNIQLVPSAPQDATQMSAMTQFSIQPGHNLQYQSAAAHIQIVLPMDAVLESSQPCDQVGSQMFSETLNFTESQLLDPTAQPVITNTRTMVAGQLTASQ